MIRILVIIISFILLSTSVANSKYGTQISQKDYLSIFIKYEIKNRDIVQNIINKCINELGKENIKITTDNKGEKIINHYNKDGFLNCTYENILQKIKPIAAINSLKSKNLEEFILNNELTFNDGKGNGKVTYIFNKEGYEIFKDGKKIGNDGWRFSKTKQLRVFMDGKKTTWRISRNFLALSIKKIGSSKVVPYFLEWEDKEIAKKRREKLIAQKKEEEQKRLAEEKRKEEQRLAEEKRKEEERLAEEKSKEEERIAEEKRKEEERLAEEKKIAEEKNRQKIINKKLSLVKETKLERSQKFIIYTQEFIKLYPDAFDIVEVAKLFIKVEPIIKGNLNDENLNDLVELEEFVRSNVDFKSYEQDIISKEQERKIELVDNEISILNYRVELLRNFLANNITSYYSKDAIKLLKVSEIITKDPKSFEEIKDTYSNINNLLNKADKYSENLKISEGYKSELKLYLQNYLTTDIATKIINQIEMIEDALENKDPETVAKVTIETEAFIQFEIIDYEERIAEEKRKEEERLAEEKRKEEQRLAEEKRKEEQRLAEEKLKETFKKYNANSQFQKDFVSAILSAGHLKIEDLKFSRNDRLIEIFGLSENITNGNLKIEKIEIKNLNKNVFYKTIKSFEEKVFDFTLFNEKKWFDEFNFINFTSKDRDFEFNSKTLSLKNLTFNNFKNNIKLIQNKNLSNDEINFLSAALSFSLGKFYAENVLLDINNNRKIEGEYFDISNLTLLDWGKWTAKNYSDADVATNTIVTYTDTSSKNIKFDKSEIINFIKNFDKNNFDIEKDYSDLLNMIDSLGNNVTNNIIVKDLSTKSEIASLKSFGLNNLNFEYIDDQKQKFLTGLDIKFEGLDLNIQKISPEFSSYFKLLGYNNVKFDFGTIYNFKNNNDLEFKIDLGITDAASISLATIFSGLSSEIFNLSGNSLGAYFLTNFKINDIKLSLIDYSLRDKLLNFGAQQENVSVEELKKILIDQIDLYSATTDKTKLFVEYRKAVVNFINGSNKIKLHISPEIPVSIAELSPYYFNPDINSIISKLNLHVSN